MTPKRYYMKAWENYSKMELDPDGAFVYGVHLLEEI